MHCKFIKLTNGDDIIVQTDDNCETFHNKEFISVVEPIQVASLRIPRGPLMLETYIMRPWLKLAIADVVQIPTKNIVVAVDVQEVAKEQYYQYIKEYTKDVDTLSNVLHNEEEGDDEFEEDDEEQSFENFIQSLGEESEEEDDGYPRTKSGRTLH